MPLLWISLAFLLGILLGDILQLSTFTWLILIGFSLFLALISIAIKRRKIILPAKFSNNKIRIPIHLPLSFPILFYALCLGGTRFQASLPDLTDPGFIAYFNDTGQEMMVTGIVTTMPDIRDTYTLLRVKTEWMHPAKSLVYSKVKGSVLVRTEVGKVFHYGDRVLVRGALETPPEDEAFSYRSYLARNGIYTLIQGTKVTRLESGQGSPIMHWIYRLREDALGLTYRLWPDPEASLFAGILLGVESGIPKTVEDDFIETGTSHIIAISGFNIAIISGLFIKVFGRIFGLYRGALAAVLAIAFYTLLVGAGASVIRAAIMGFLTLGATLVGRRQIGYHALAITTSVMAFENPHVLWDVGFQLSFTATLGLVLYAEPLTQIFKSLASRLVPEERAASLSGPIGEFILFTFAAQATTLPVIAYHFGRISWISFLANPVILPVQPPVMILGGISLILGLIWFPIGNLFAFIACPFVTYTIRAVEFFADYTKGALVLGKISFLWIALYYIILMGITINWSKIKGWFSAEPERKSTRVFIPIITLLGVLTFVTYRTVMTAPDGKLHLTLLDVGTGDAVLIKSPDGRHILINGGPSTSLLADGVGRRLPPLQRKFDWWVVASTQQNQIAALPRLVERYPPGNVLWAGLPSASRQADYLREAIKDAKIPIQFAQVDHVLNLGEGAILKILTVGNRGATLLLEWGYFKAVLPLGISDGDFESLRMGMDIGTVNLLILAENGYTPANPPIWIYNLNPQLVLLSVAADDRDGLPDQEMLDMLNRYTLLSTDINGWIEVSTDGNQMWVEVEHVTD